MKLIYKPYTILTGLLAGMLANKAFERVWGAFTDEDPFDPDDRGATWAEVLAAAAVGGAIVGVVRALVRRSGALAFERATGFWPGDDIES